MHEAEQIGNLPEVVELDRRFHERFLEVASSETAGIAWRSIAGRTQLFQAIGNSVRIKFESIAEVHQPFADALKDRDAETLRIDQTRSSLGELDRSYPASAKLCDVGTSPSRQRRHPSLQALRALSGYVRSRPVPGSGGLSLSLQSEAGCA